MLDPDALPAAVVRLDAAGRILDGNAVFAGWAGEQELVGRPLSDVLRSRDDGFDTIAHVDGSRRPVLATRTRSGDGELVVLLDATEPTIREGRLSRDRALEVRTRNRLELIIDASIAFSDAATEAELAEILANTVARSYQAEQAAVFLVADAGESLALAAGTDPLADRPPARALIERVADERHVVTISDAAQADALAPGLGEAMRTAAVDAVLVAPIRHDAIVFGVFVCFFLHPRRFDREAAPLADALAGQAGQAATTLRLQRQLEHAAMHDETTGLPNRRLLEAQLVSSAQVSHALMATLFIDLDGFKTVNDELGHHVGDQLLRRVGDRLQASVRHEDFVARYGGDEFVVVCEVPDAEVAHEIAERIRASIEAPYSDLPAGAAVQASIGMCIARPGGHGWNPDYLIRVADQAMYSAKNAGGNRVVDIELYV